MTIMATRSADHAVEAESTAPGRARRWDGRRVAGHEDEAQLVGRRGSLPERVGYVGAAERATVGGADANRVVASGVRPVRPSRGRVRRCTGSVAPTLHGSRLTRRGRLLVTLMWAALVGVAAVPIVGNGHDVVPDVRTVTVRIESGETLWQVAREADPTGDPRQVVDAIVELNDLRSGSDVRPGDTLRVPVSAE